MMLGQTVLVVGGCCVYQEPTEWEGGRGSGTSIIWATHDLQLQTHTRTHPIRHAARTRDEAGLKT
jgi:hypothetical protein